VIVIVHQEVELILFGVTALIHGDKLNIMADILEPILLDIINQFTDIKKIGSFSGIKKSGFLTIH
jgi:hypothetical protein